MTQLIQQDDISYAGLEASVLREKVCVEYREEPHEYTATLVCRIGYRSSYAAEPETQLSNSKEKGMRRSCPPMNVCRCLSVCGWLMCIEQPH